MQREFATIDPAPQLDVEAQDIAGLIADTAADLHRAITENGTPTTELAIRAAALSSPHTSPCATGCCA